MKITVYTVTNCPFSKQEKDYLQQKNLQFEEKNLEKDKQYLTEMLAVSNNFAGTPVTKIEKDDGQIVVLKGFTRAEFDKELSPPGSLESTSATDDKSQEEKPLSSLPPTPPAPTPPPSPTNSAPSAPEPVSPPKPLSPAPVSQQPAPVPSVPSTSSRSTSSGDEDPQVDSLLNQLKQKASQSPLTESQSLNQPSPGPDLTASSQSPTPPTPPTASPPPAPASSQPTTSTIDPSPIDPGVGIDVPDFNK